MLARLFLVPSLLALAAAVPAQCSLTITGTGAPGTALTFAVDGSAPAGFVFLVVGETQGTTTISLGSLGSLTLGLATPFVPVPLGQANALGDVTRTVTIPAAVQGAIDLFGQGVTVGFSLLGPGGPSLPTLAFCTTNVVGFHVGV